MSINAIILAAGKGQRLMPLTSKVPKPLTSINGEKIIERQIRFLLEANVSSITVVAGYLYEEFLYLKDRFQQVEILVNELYDTSNNFYSLFLAKGLLRDTWIIEGDIYLITNVFIRHARSVYYTSIKVVEEYEWYFNYNVDLKIQSIKVADRRKFPDSFVGAYYILMGISFWTRGSSDKIKRIFERIMNNDTEFNRYKNTYWDQLIVDHLEEFDLYVHRVSQHAWMEVDSIKDIEKLDQMLVSKSLSI